MLSAQNTISIAATVRRVASEPGSTYAMNVGTTAAGIAMFSAQTQVSCNGANANDRMARHHSTPTMRRSART